MSDIFNQSQSEFIRNAQTPQATAAGAAFYSDAYAPFSTSLKNSMQQPAFNDASSAEPTENLQQSTAPGETGKHQPSWKDDTFNGIRIGLNVAPAVPSAFALEKLKPHESAMYDMKELTEHGAIPKGSELDFWDLKEYVKNGGEISREQALATLPSVGRALAKGYGAGIGALGLDYLTDKTIFKDAPNKTFSKIADFGISPLVAFAPLSPTLKIGAMVATHAAGKLLDELK